MEEVVREGFLCPVCLQDLGDVTQLQAHVEQRHGVENEAFGGQLRGFFGRKRQRKAKQRLRALDSSLDLGSLSRGFGESAVTGSPQRYEPSPQQPGLTRSHTESLKQLRDARMDQFALETNTLIIRLDKLISNSPLDPGKKKSFEKGVIPWMSDSESKLCTVCLSRFNPISRRKHHCRLCGKLTCSECSRFINFLAARKLTNPAFAAGYEEPNPASTGEEDRGSGGSPAGKKAEKLLSATLSLLKRDGSEHSFSSILSNEGDDELRICGRCKDLLDRREEQVERASEAPVLVSLYERLRSLVSQATQLFPSYARVAQSLQEGESLHSLDSGKEMRLKIIKIQEQIDIVSKKILNYGIGGDVEEPPSPRQILLQRNVRSFATAFLQDTVMGLAELPSPSDYARLQAASRRRVEDRIARERSESRATPPPVARPCPERPWVGLAGPAEGGWSPATAPCPTNPFLEEEAPIDPLQQQISIIKGYLRQAVEAGRLEEVHTLELNLRELEAASCIGQDSGRQ